MKRLLIAVILVFSAFMADAQKRTVITDIIKVYNEFWLGGRKVTSIETDSTFASATHNKIPTVKAVKDYVAANGGGISALTGDVTASGPGSAVATIATASASVRGLLSSADWSTFNGKVGGSGTNGFLPKFSSSTGLTVSALDENSANYITSTTRGFTIGDDVSSSAAGQGFRLLRGTLSGGYFSNGSQLIFQTSTSHDIYFATNATERIRIQAAGNVGIGTNNPSGILHLFGSSTLNAYMESSSNSDVQFQFSASSSPKFLLGYTSANGFRLYNYGTASASLFVESSTSNLGISTTSPTARMHIVGGGATSATNNLLVTNSAAAQIIKSQDDRKVTLGYNLDFTESSTTVGNGATVINSKALSLTIGAGSSNFNFLAGSVGNIVANGITVLRAFPSAINCVAIGAAVNPSYTLDVLGSAGHLGVRGNTFLGATGSAANARLHVVGSGSGTGTNTAVFHNSTGTSESLIINDNGSVGVGGVNTTALFSVIRAANDNLFYSDCYSTTNGHTNYWLARKSNSNTKGTRVETTSGSALGALFFQGVNTGASFDYGARIIATQNGASGTYVPTDLIFSTYTESSQNAGQFVLSTNGSVGVNNGSPSASAVLDVASTTKGFLLPRMNATQASAIATPPQGLQVFVTSTNATFTSIGWWGYNGTAWVRNFLLADPILVGGNTQGASLMIGTNDNFDVQFETGGVEKMRLIHATGNLAVGATSAAAKVHIVGDGATSATWALQVHNNATNNALMVRNDGRTAIGTASPAVARLTIAAGTTSIAPLNIPAGTNTTSVEAGAIENDGTNLKYSPDVFVRYDLIKGFTGISTALDFPNLSLGQYSVLTFSDTRVKAGDRVLVANPNFNGGAMLFTGGCTVDGTIYVQAFYIGPSSLDMPSQNYSYSIIR